MWLAYLVISLVLIAFVTQTGFFVLATAKRIEAAGLRLSGFRRGVVYVWLAVGIPADAFYNWLIGSWFYLRDRPREVMYSSHVGDLARAGDARGLAEAAFLNAALPGHIHLPDETDRSKGDPAL
jgi:hypothetical protein